MPDRHFCAPQHNQNALSCDDLQSLICDKCASAAIAVAPGSDGVRGVGVLIARGVARRQWCLAHAPWAPPARVLP